MGPVEEALPKYLELYLKENIDISRIKIDLDANTDEKPTIREIKLQDEPVFLEQIRGGNYSEIISKYQLTPQHQNKVSLTPYEQKPPYFSVLNSSEKKTRTRDVCH
jgi:hypothetical protein